MSSIKAQDGQAAAAEVQRQPIRELAGLKANPDSGCGIGPEGRGNSVDG
jgi:hypothetical protein